MSIPEIDNVLCTLKTFMEGFNPTTLMYLDIRGHWENNPSTLRDRISNELWFRIWEMKQNGNDIKRAGSLIYPLVRDESSWDVTKRVFNAFKKNNSEGINDFLMIMEVLYRLIEYEAHKRNGEDYVADWDRKGRARRARYQGENDKFLIDLRKTLDANSKIDIFYKMIGLLRGDEESIYTQLSVIIAEEEKVREDLNDFLTDMSYSQKKDEIYHFIYEQISSAMWTRMRSPQALVRPCLKLITNPDIDISSGIQYEALNILGKLKDVRCMDILLNALETSSPRHTNLRCNLIYVIGSLKHKKALNHLIDVLEGPDSIYIPSRDGSPGYNQSLLSEKCEAIWALGKLGPEAVEALSVLIQYSNSTDSEMKILLAWAVGMIGNGQKEKYGGIDAGVFLTLMNLLTDKDSETFEEAAFALRMLDLPDFLHTLYLHNFTTVPVLSLKSSSTGLFELSETILHLASIKKPIVVAVTGDSGTGKTYFCQAIANGFSGLQGHDILYLMRDEPTHKIFNKMLGSKWLKEHIDPIYHEDYSQTEGEDNPDTFFERFMNENADKKLIILDGWRDEVYFHQIIRTFYEKGYLDVIVNFRTTFSTRRINLEEREGSLERVKAHLPLVEDMAIEETRFYREGAVLIYNLDNSIPSRLNREEISEIFQRKKLHAWGDQIRIGGFERDVKPLRIYDSTLSSCWEEIPLEIKKISPNGTSHFTPKEASFSRMLNEDVGLEPNLLQRIRQNNVAIHRIVFYTQGQIAFCGYDGSVGIFTGLNNRIYYTLAHKGRVDGLAIVGGDIFSMDDNSELKVTSFYKNRVVSVGNDDSPACTITSYRDSGIATGHLDGTIRLWDMQSEQVRILKGHQSAVLSIAIDRCGKICSGGEDGELCLWDLENNRFKIFGGHEATISALGWYPDGRIVTGMKNGYKLKKTEQTTGSKIRIVDVEKDTCRVFQFCNTESINTVNVYYDGRIFVGVKTLLNQVSRGNLIMVDPRSCYCQYKMLGGHAIETRDCLTMGPRIITCGAENSTENTLRIWGTETYVKQECDKLKIMPENLNKPPYCRSQF